MSNADNSERRSNATVCAPPKSLISHTSPEHSPKSWVWSKHMSIGFPAGSGPKFCNGMAPAYETQVPEITLVPAGQGAPQTVFCVSGRGLPSRDIESIDQGLVRIRLIRQVLRFSSIAWDYKPGPGMLRP